MTRLAPFSLALAIVVSIGGGAQQSAEGAIQIDTNFTGTFAGLENVTYNAAGSINEGTLIRGFSSAGSAIDFYSTLGIEEFSNQGIGQANIIGISTSTINPLLDSDIDFKFTIEAQDPNVAFAAIFFNIDRVQADPVENVIVEATDGMTTTFSSMFVPTLSQNGILVFGDNGTLIKSVTLHILTGSIERVRQIRVANDQIVTAPPVLPEPASMLAWSFGLLLVGGVSARRRCRRYFAPNAER